MTSNNEEQPHTEEAETLSVNSLLEESLRKSIEETKEFKDKYLRSLAEMENMKRRLQQEKQEMISYAIDNILSELLVPLDSLESALSHTENLSPELKNWALGFKMIAAQFRTIFETQGVTTFSAQGEAFDPHFHEAIETVESTSHRPGQIIKEIARGYRHGNRILRHARVVVAKQANTNEAGE
jgi:molecular chaperone GrpE